MPSPIGHAIAGATIAWALAPRGFIRARAEGQAWGLTPDIAPGTTRGLTPYLAPDITTGLTLACVALAVAPDLDLLMPWSHRTVTHSVTAVAVVTILAMTVTGKVTARLASRIAFACVAAYASHLLLDWMAFDGAPPRGVQLFWPFSTRWYISDWDVFRGTERRHIFTMQSVRFNALAIGQEILILAPVAIIVRLARRLFVSDPRA